MTNISQLMKQAKEMQDKMAELQQKVEKTEVEGSAGGGLVKVLINGKHNASKVQIDPSLINSNEIDVLEDLIVAAINDATKKVSENMSSELGSLSGGLNLPPGMKLPF
ncbi:MAG: YbaB/EbfC family nucleoid-associated protein [Rickettsiales bacterium]|nr:YbaB/EbfC family nucleoid-associated protein [Rickettsiales bacterium]MAY89757.1 YbaB/EbfC family nucleoid-associated protein [Rickettsiales bacterium]RPF77894.1 MAG: YbaB/EbfC family nucleoid-associated protein [Rickettsiales bacterium TMED254]